MCDPILSRGDVIKNFLNMGQSQPHFCLFSSFSYFFFFFFFVGGAKKRCVYNSNQKSIEWCAWDSNPGRRIVSVDETVVDAHKQILT